MVSSTRGTRGTKILFARKGERRSRGGGRVASIPKNRAILFKTHHSDPPKPHAPFLAVKKKISVFLASLAQFKKWFRICVSWASVLIRIKSEEVFQHKQTIIHNIRICRRASKHAEVIRWTTSSLPDFSEKICLVLQTGIEQKAWGDPHGHWKVGLNDGVPWWVKIYPE